MANQQQDQTQRSGTDREPLPEQSPDRTIPGQAHRNAGDQGKQNPPEKAEETPGSPGTNPGMPQRGPASNPQDSGRRDDDGSSGERR